jgi:small conductance mechanosensitive channel
MDLAKIDLNTVNQHLTKLAAAYAPKFLLAIAVLVLGLFIISRIRKILNSIVKRKDLDPSLGYFLGGLLTWALRAMLLISVASMIGVVTTSFVAVLGAAGLAIGLALQGSLANFAGGVLIMVFKPFKTGDYILANGEEGTVRKIDVFATVLTKLDNRRIILPNGPLAGGTIVNVTAEETRRVDLKIGISYNDHIQETLSLLEKMCAAHPKVLEEPLPFAAVTEYGDSSINLTVRSWVKQADYWEVFFMLNKSLKPTLDAAGVTIPFPQRDVHVFNEK